MVNHRPKNWCYSLISYTSLVDDKTPGGMEAIPTQFNKSEDPSVLAYAIQKLQ